MSRSTARARIEAEFLQPGVPPGTVLPSARELARRWSLDFSTVSRAILELTAAGSLVRVSRRRVQTRSFQPLLAPVGVLDVIPAVLEEARGVAGLFGVVCQAIPWHDETRVDADVLAALDQKVGGLLLWPCPVAEEVLQRARQQGVPVVVCDAPRAGVNSVRGNNREMGRLAAAHLIERGYTRLIYLTSDPTGHSVRQERWEGFQDACREAGIALGASTLRVVEAADLKEVLQARDRRSLQSTGWIASDDRLALRLGQEAERLARATGRPMAIVSCQDSPACAAHSIPLTAVAVNDREVARLATLVLIKQMQTLASTGRMLEPQDVLLQPRLRIRESSPPAARAPLKKVPPPEAPKNAPVSLARRGLGLSPEARSEQVAEILAQPHPWLAAHRPIRSVPIPLGPLCNQQRARTHQWLGGLPLLHLADGLHHFHGIDYLVEAVRRDGAGDVVVFRNPDHHRKKKPLARRVELPVPGPCRALAFLLAAGFTAHRETLAEVTFRPMHGPPETHPVRTAGSGSGLEAEVQDWWPTAAHFDNGRAMRVPVTEGGDPLFYERYLYSWLWPLSRPWLEGGTLEVEFRAESPATLALVAVTRLA